MARKKAHSFEYDVLRTFASGCNSAIKVIQNSPIVFNRNQKCAAFNWSPRITRSVWYWLIMISLEFFWWARLVLNERDCQNSRFFLVYIRLLTGSPTSDLGAACSLSQGRDNRRWDNLCNLALIQHASHGCDLPGCVNERGRSSLSFCHPASE